ncbi:MAG: phosphoribosyltransferase [Candidatus Eremiobacteraeota bacterium]|nr:phosphoribosyltransferase [Candidatus Eremiobacteraeota bacterium]
MKESETFRPFRDRTAAGRELAEHLRKYERPDDVVVLALPRGGVPVGYEIARVLGVPLDVVVVRKLGVPGRAELAMGALATGGLFWIDRHIASRLEVGQDEIDAVLARERRELERRERAYRDLPPPQVHGKVVICVDDGIATGASIRAAVAALRQGAPAKIVVAVPVAAAEVAAELREIADEVIVSRTPPNFRAVSLWYEDFSQTTDEEVRSLLRLASGDSGKR